MVAWDHRIAGNWASLFGLANVPLFGKGRQPAAPGDHSVLLDGRRSSLTFSRGNAAKLLESGRPVEWAWSSNVPRSVVVDDKSGTVYGVRWDRPNVVRSLTQPTPDAAASFLIDLDGPSAEEVETSVNRALSIFRSVRTEIGAFGGNDLDATNAFDFLLLLADFIRQQGIARPPRYLAEIRDQLDLPALPFARWNATSPAIESLPIGDLAAQLVGSDGQVLDP